MAVLVAAGKCGAVHDIEEMQQVVLLITRETAFCLNVCYVVFGFGILDFFLLPQTVWLVGVRSMPFFFLSWSEE